MALAATTIVDSHLFYGRKNGREGEKADRMADDKRRKNVDIVGHLQDRFWAVGHDGGRRFAHTDHHGRIGGEGLQKIDEALRLMVTVA